MPPIGIVAVAAGTAVPTTTEAAEPPSARQSPAGSLGSASALRPRPTMATVITRHRRFITVAPAIPTRRRHPSTTAIECPCDRGGRPAPPSGRAVAGFSVAILSNSPLGRIGSDDSLELFRFGGSRRIAGAAYCSAGAIRPAATGPAAIHPTCGAGDTAGGCRCFADVLAPRSRQQRRAARRGTYQRAACPIADYVGRAAAVGAIRPGD